MHHEPNSLGYRETITVKSKPETFNPLSSPALEDSGLPCTHPWLTTLVPVSRLSVGPGSSCSSWPALTSHKALGLLL